MNISRVRALIANVRADLDDLEKLVAEEAAADGTDSPWMTVPEYAAHIKMSADTVRERLIPEGMPHTGRGRLTRIHRDEADAWRKAR